MDIVWNLFFLLGGVAVMMVGMKMMGAGLEKFAGAKMKNLPKPCKKCANSHKECAESHTFSFIKKCFIADYQISYVLARFLQYIFYRNKSNKI